MPLSPGDTWTGLDTLRVLDEATGKIVVDGLILTDMDIDPRQNRVTMMVSSDIGYDNRTEDRRYVEGGRFEITQEK